MTPSWPKLMGVLNITPDSFSDGGSFASLENCSLKLSELLSFGPAILDVGAESTAPFNSPCSEEKEKGRFLDIFLPVFIEWGEKNQKHPFFLKGTLSIDTYKPEVFSFVVGKLKPHFPYLKFIWNDVSGVLDKEALRILEKDPKVSYVFCHNLAPMRKDSSHHMSYAFEGGQQAFLEHLKSYFQEGLDYFGEFKERIFLDPCFGFSKTLQQNDFLIQKLPLFIRSFPRETPWVIGVSKKSFLQNAVREYRQSPKDWAPVECLHTGLLSLWFERLKGYRLAMRVHNPSVFYGALKAQTMVSDESTIL